MDIIPSRKANKANKANANIGFRHTKFTSWRNSGDKSWQQQLINCEIVCRTSRSFFIPLLLFVDPLTTVLPR